MVVVSKKALTNLVTILFISVNLLFIFLQIHKQSQFIKFSYSSQRLEKEYEQLDKQRNELVHQIYLQQGNKNIKKYASQHLGMSNTKVTQIHKVEL